MPTQPETGVDRFASLCEQAEYLGERLNQDHGDYAAYSSIMDAIGEAEAEHKAIRNQERQRVREVLEADGRLAIDLANAATPGKARLELEDGINRAEAALDSLEDSDA
jgi:hypothetical protein